MSDDSNEIVILADDRERGSGVIEALRSLGATVYIRRLELGDYIISEDFAIERKSVNDFISSIIDRRLFEQAMALLKAFPRVTFIIEGNMQRALAWREVTIRHVLGALSSLLLMGVSTVFTSNTEETAYLIYNMAKKLQVKEKKKVRVSPTKIRMAKGGKTLRGAQVNLIASLPGISYELAERILEYFGSPKRFFNAHPSELRKVRGLGDKRVKNIVRILNTTYTEAKRKAEANLMDYVEEDSNTNSQ